MRRAAKLTSCDLLAVRSVALTRSVHPASVPMTAAIASSNPPRTGRFRSVRGPGSLYLSVGRAMGQPPCSMRRPRPPDLRIGAVPVSPGPPGLADQPDPFDDHLPIDCFDHVINCETRHAHCCERLH